MQRIERYGVIALVLLLVTIAAVSFWEDGSTPTAASRAGEVASAPTLRQGQGSNSGRRLTPRDADKALPVTANPSRDARERAQRARDNQRLQRLRQAKQERLRQAEQERLAAEAASQEQAARAAAVQDLPFPAGLQAGGGGAAEVKKADSPRNRSRNAPRTIRAQDELASQTKMRMNAARGAEEAASTATGVHVVKSGETLGAIALSELGSSKRWREIAALNGGSDKIFVGQKLRLPGREGGGASSVAAVASKPQAKGQASSKGGKTYTVKKGDMLSVIAQTQLGSAKRWREIAALNPSVNPDRLLTGTELVMPGGSSSGSTSRGAVLLAQNTKKGSSKPRVR